MPKKNLRLGEYSRYNPYTWELKIRPFEMYRQEYMALEAALDMLRSQTATLLGKLDKDKDPKSYAKVSEYLNTLEDSARSIATRGLDSTTASNILNSKANFLQNVAPVGEAVTKREKYIDYDIKEKQRDESLIRNQWASDLSVDYFVDNPNANIYEKSASGKQIFDESSKILSNLLRLKTAPSISVLKENPYFMRIAKDAQFNELDYLDWYNGSDTADQKLYLGIVKGVVEARGILNWTKLNEAGKEVLDTESLRSAYSWAANGLPYSFGEDKDDYKYSQAYFDLLAATKAKGKKGGSSSGALDTRPGSYLIVFKPTEEVKKKTDELRGKYFNKKDAKGNPVFTNAAYWSDGVSPRYDVLEKYKELLKLNEDINNPNISLRERKYSKMLKQKVVEELGKWNEAHHTNLRDYPFVKERLTPNSITPEVNWDNPKLNDEFKNQIKFLEEALEALKNWAEASGNFTRGNFTGALDDKEDVAKTYNVLFHTPRLSDPALEQMDKIMKESFLINFDGNEDLLNNAIRVFSVGDGNSKKDVPKLKTILDSDPHFTPLISASWRLANKNNIPFLVLYGKDGSGKSFASARIEVNPEALPTEFRKLADNLAILRKKALIIEKAEDKSRAWKDAELKKLDVEALLYMNTAVASISLNFLPGRSSTSSSFWGTYIEGLGSYLPDTEELDEEG